jgi:hypothetical protein
VTEPSFLPVTRNRTNKPPPEQTSAVVLAPADFVNTDSVGFRQRLAVSLWSALTKDRFFLH